MCPGNSIKYGPYKAVAPFAQAPLRVHFPNNNPFAEADYLEREIEVRPSPAQQTMQRSMRARGGHIPPRTLLGLHCSFCRIESAHELAVAPQLLALMREQCRCHIGAMWPWKSGMRFATWAPSRRCTSWISSKLAFLRASST